MSYVKFGYNLIQFCDLIDQQLDLEDCDNVYVVSMKVKLKLEIEFEDIDRKFEKLKVNVFFKFLFDLRNIIRIDVVNEKFINGNGFFENGVIILDKICFVYVIKI